MRIVHAPLLLALLCTFGCVKCEGEVIESQGPIDPLPGPVPPEADPNAIFDSEGRLQESDERVAGLVLPRGLEEQPIHGERRHSWITEVPVDKVLEYFGPRLITGHVSQEAGGATYSRALPAGIEGPTAVRMDVGIHPRPGGGTRIELFELPPVPQNPPSEAELIERFEEQQRLLD